MASNDQTTFDSVGDWGGLQSEIPTGTAFDEEISDADREVLQRFEEKMDVINAKTDRFKDSYKETLLYCCHEFAVNVGGLATTLQDDAEGREAVNDICLWLDDQDLSPYTMESSLSSLRVFGHLMLDYTPDAEFDEEELPKRFAEIDPGKYTRNLDPTPLPSEVVTYEEAIEMAKQQDNPRDAALIIVQWAAGLRPMCELHRLRYKHVKDEGDRYVITVPDTAKTGSRTVYIYAGVAVLRKWLEQEHPAHLDSEPDMTSETPIWTHHGENKPIVYGTLSSVFERAADNAGVGKPTSPQGFRRSCASFHARQPSADEEMLRDRFGWSRLSSAPYHYIARFSEARAVKTAKAQGHEIDEEEEDDPVAPVRCESCNEWTTRGYEHCIWCSHPVGEEVQTISESIEHPHKDGADLLEMIMEGEVTAEDLRSAKTLEPIIKTRADFWMDIDELITLAERYQDDDNETASAFGIGGVVAWMTRYASRVMKRWVRLQDSILRLHPAMQYPPNRRTAAGIGVGWLVIVTLSTAILLSNGLAAEIASGEPLAVTSAVLGLSLGALWIHSTSIDINDLQSALQE
ncbi:MULTISPECIES: tyrosine-type recombinase/integrase [Halobacteriales]|uniref:tyrosine-type recombinase/integrase n=1 Tax=Halobacteriales TaxID=2235 RepID=UPI000FE3ABBB